MGSLVQATTQSSTSLLQVYLVFNMVKELITIEMERDSLQQKWGFTVQGGKDLALTAKIASVKRFSPADRAGLEKMDYVWTVNNNEVFKMTQKEITNEIVNSKLQLTLQVERGTFIVPSFDEIWPQAGKGRPGDARRKRMGMDYILEAMQPPGLGPLPQPDNFTTCGRLGIEINQYNNPVECYHDDTIEEMREEKVLIDHPELADKILKTNSQKHEQINPLAAQKLNANKWNPNQSSVLKAIQAQ